ncbi:hypothetical protein [Sphingobium sp. AP50]|uniref:hypothetical protein n=1 Tax=Sphingobium sp. AP50 TaxID=1884369 RepID=UPI000B845FD5|nr:hypothetical protein [Sphingobium sp. AP50]
MGRSSGTSVEYSARRSGSSSSGIDQRSSTSLNQSESRGRDWSTNWIEQVGGNVGGNLAGQGRGGLGGSFDVRAGVSANQNDQLSQGFKESRSSDEANNSFSGVRDEHSTGSSASASEGTYEKGGSFDRASTNSSSSQGREDSLSRARSYQESADRLDELSQQLSRDASYAETHGMQLSKNLSQDLAQWYRKEQSSNPGLDAPELWATELTGHQRMVRDSMINRWMGEKRDSIRSEVQGRLHEPDMVDVPHPAMGSFDDVRKYHHPGGVDGLPKGPASGDPGTAVAIIAEGQRSYAADKASAQIQRSGSIEAAADVQSDVNRETSRKFFQTHPPED